MTDTLEPVAAPVQKTTTLKKKVGLSLLTFVVVFGATSVVLQQNPALLRFHHHRHDAERVCAWQNVQINVLNKRVKVLENRIDALDTTQTTPATIAAVGADVKTDTANTAAVAHLQNDLMGLSSAMTALQTEVKATGATAAETRESATSLVASVVAYIQLRDAAFAGRGFANELAVLRELSKNDSALQVAVTKLEPVATSGAPTLAALDDELMQREPAVSVALAKESAQNWWERLLAAFQGFITVRPLHGGEGDALADLESALTKNGAAAALDAYHTLPEGARTSLADWQKKLEARQQIDQQMAVIATHFTTLPTGKNP